jgi:hypothetical protein
VASSLFVLLRSRLWTVGAGLSILLSVSAVAWGAASGPSKVQSRIIMLLDESGSMAQTDPGSKRIQVLRDYLDYRIAQAETLGESISAGIVNFAGLSQIAFPVTQFSRGGNLSNLHGAIRAGTIVPSNTDFRSALCTAWSQATGRTPPPLDCPNLTVVLPPPPSPSTQLYVVLLTDGYPAPVDQELQFNPADADHGCHATISNPSPGHTYMCGLTQLWTSLLQIKHVTLIVGFYDPEPNVARWKTVRPYWCMMATQNEECLAAAIVPEVPPPPPPTSPRGTFQLCRHNLCKVDPFTESAVFTFTGLQPRDRIHLESPRPSSTDVSKVNSAQVKLRRSSTFETVSVYLPQPGLWTATSSNPQSSLRVAVFEVTGRLDVSVLPRTPTVGESADVSAALRTSANHPLIYVPSAPEKAATNLSISRVVGSSRIPVKSSLATFSYDGRPRIFTYPSAITYREPGAYQFLITLDLGGRRLALGQRTIVVSARPPAPKPKIEVVLRVPSSPRTWLVDGFWPRIGFPVTISVPTDVTGIARLVDPRTPHSVVPLSSFFELGSTTRGFVTLQRSNQTVLTKELRWSPSTSTSSIDVRLPKNWLQAGTVHAHVSATGVLKSGSKFDENAAGTTFIVRRAKWAELWEASAIGYWSWLLPCLAFLVLLSLWSTRTGRLRAR